MVVRVNSGHPSKARVARTAPFCESQASEIESRGWLASGEENRGKKGREMERDGVREGRREKGCKGEKEGRKEERQGRREEEMERRREAHRKEARK